MTKNGFGIYDLQWLMYHKTKPNQTYFVADEDRVSHVFLTLSMIEYKIFPECFSAM